MLARFSVKKPFYVVVCAIIILILGGVSLTSIKTNLLPEFSTPYLAVITTDVGASPEQVQSDVTEVLEGSLSTVTGVETVTSYSAENYSMVFLEFADGTDMDSALVKVSAAANQVAPELPETAGTPTYIEMSMDMMATMYVGVTDENRDPAALSEFVENTVVPALERREGVASVSVTGTVEDTVTIELNEDKIANVNDGILGSVNRELAKTKRELDQAEAKVDKAQAKLKRQEAKLKEQEQATEEQLGNGQAGLTTAIAGQTAAVTALSSQVTTLQAQSSALQLQVTELQEQIKLVEGTSAAEALQAQVDALTEQKATLDEQAAGLQEQLDAANAQLSTYQEQAGTANAAALSAASTFATAQAQVADAKATLAANRQQIAEGRAQYKEARKSAREQANVNALLDIDTLSQLISAQNLEMPAGYIEDAKGEQWVVKVGEAYTSVEELERMVLTKVDGVGSIRLDDVADVVTMDNVGETYANLNGMSGLVLSVTKSTTANTSEVSAAVNEQLRQLEQDNPGLNLVDVMDQGAYIDTYIWTILQSLLIGAVLAIIVLALFLRDVKPTLIVAFAIPFSVLLAIVIMYFTNLDFNVMTLGAMSLAIGMLVDNSIVVMENIYRLRGRGVAPAAAAAQGARQVSGAVIASTLTTVCVFLPLVFTSGTVRQLMVPFALTIGYVLVASLLVALTVVPTLASVLFKKPLKGKRRAFGRVQDAYAKALGWTLRHKAPVLVLAVALLGVSVAGVVNMGIVMIPEMASNQVEIYVDLEDQEQEEAYETMDEVVAALAGIDGVADVGAVDSGFANNMMMGSFSDANSYTGLFMLYATVDPAKVHTEAQMAALTDEVYATMDELGLPVETEDAMSGMSSLTGGGVTIEVTGEDYQRVLELSDEVVEVVGGIEGYEDATNGQEEAEGTLHLVVDKNKAAKLGTSVGQIYQALAADLKDEADAFSMRTADGNTVEVRVSDEEYQPLSKANLLDWTFEDKDGDEHRLSEVATLQREDGVLTIMRENGAYYATVSADIAEGYNTTLLARQLQPELDKIDVPSGYSVELAGTDGEIQDMLVQMTQLMLLGFLLLYLVMVAQFGSLLSPFIIVLTVPLAFTGGLLALLATGEQLSVMSLLGFVILMGTVVNNGIVFVDYANQLRLGGVAKRPALIATGRTRMRPIFMTALTTILAMCAMIFSQEVGSSMQRGMALVVAGGLLYATLMTLFVVPIMYDLLSRRPLRPISLDSAIDAEADDAAEVIAQMGPEARETYAYETARQRRKRIRQEGGRHGKLHQSKQERQ